MMSDNYSKVFREYLESSIQKTQDEEKNLILENRKDDSNHVKVRCNIFHIFKTVFSVLTNNKDLDEKQVKSLFLDKTKTISENWEKSYKKALAFNDVEKILIEEIKIKTVDEIRDKFLGVWEETDDRV